MAFGTERRGEERANLADGKLSWTLKLKGTSYEQVSRKKHSLEIGIKGSLYFH